MSLDVLVRALERGNPYHKPAGPGGGQFASGASGGGVSVPKSEWVLGTDKFGMQAWVKNPTAVAKPASAGKSQSLSDAGNLDMVDGKRGIGPKSFDHFTGEAAKGIGNTIIYAQSAPGRQWLSLRDKAGKIQAAALLDKSDPRVHFVDDITSNVRGGGTRLMARICEDAARQKKGVQLVAIEGAKGFYKKIGMSGDHVFEFTMQQADSFAKKYARAIK